LERLEHKERSNTRSDQRATLEDIVVAGANQSLAITFWCPPWGRDGPSSNGDNQESLKPTEEENSTTGTIKYDRRCCLRGGCAEKPIVRTGDDDARFHRRQLNSCDAVTARDTPNCQNQKNLQNPLQIVKTKRISKTLKRATNAPLLHPHANACHAPPQALLLNLLPCKPG